MPHKLVQFAAVQVSSLKGSLQPRISFASAATPYLYSLLRLTDESSPLEEIEPQTRRWRALEAIKRILLRERLNQHPAHPRQSYTVCMIGQKARRRLGSDGPELGDFSKLYGWSSVAIMFWQCYMQ
jgi:hypothetical protein